MNRFGIFLAMAATAATYWPTPLMADTPAKKTLVIAVDLSQKNLALSDPTINDTVLEMVLIHAKKLDLQNGDGLVLRAFAPPGSATRPLPDWHAAIEFSYSQYGGKDPRILRPLLAKHIPALLDVAPEGDTDLHWSIKRLAREFDCARDEVHLVLISNMVEAGRFQNGKYYLAPLNAGTFASCASIALVGFDAAFVSGSAAALDTAEGAWTEILLGAGFGDVRFLR